MPVLVTCKFKEGPIKHEGAIVVGGTTFFRRLRAKTIQTDWSDLAKFTTRPSFYACPDFLQVR